MTKLSENAKSASAANQSLATGSSSSCLQYLTLSNHGWSLAVFVLPGRSSICRWPVPASLFLEDVVDLLKRLLALRVAQDISSLEKYGGILLEFNRDGGELPSTLNFSHEVAHVGKQGFEHFWLLVLLDRRKNLCLQFLPGWLVVVVSHVRAWITRVIHLCNWLTLAMQIEHAVLLRNIWLVIVKLGITVSVAAFGAFIEQGMTAGSVITLFRRYNHLHILFLLSIAKAAQHSQSQED